MKTYIYELFHYSDNALALTVDNDELLRLNPPKMFLTSYVADEVGTEGPNAELAVDEGLDVVAPLAQPAAFEFGDCELFNCSFFTTG